MKLKTASEVNAVSAALKPDVIVHRSVVKAGANDLGSARASDHFVYTYYISLITGVKNYVEDLNRTFCTRYQKLIINSSITKGPLFNKGPHLNKGDFQGVDVILVCKEHISADVFIAIFRAKKFSAFKKSQSKLKQFREKIKW